MPAAQNALLKTLEEPPSASVFMLVTSRPDVLLPTVRSRCPRLRFRPLGADEVAAALIKRGRSEAEARAVAATADGSIGRALEASAGELVEAREVAQRVLRGRGAATIRAGGSRARRNCWRRPARAAPADREQLAAHLRAMASLLRDVELLATGADRAALANPDCEPALERLTRVPGRARRARVSPRSTRRSRRSTGTPA